MKYRLDVCVFSAKEKVIKDLYDAIADSSGELETVNKGKHNEEKSRVRMHKCYHDETPPKPCELMNEWHSD